MRGQIRAMKKMILPLTGLHADAASVEAELIRLGLLGKKINYAPLLDHLL